MKTIKELIRLKKKSKLNQNDWVNNVSKEESESILRSLDDMDNGKTIEHESVKKIYEKWL